MTALGAGRRTQLPESTPIADRATALLIALPFWRNSLDLCVQHVESTGISGTTRRKADYNVLTQEEHEKKKRRNDDVSSCSEGAAGTETHLRRSISSQKSSGTPCVGATAEPSAQQNVLDSTSSNHAEQKPHLLRELGGRWGNEYCSTKTLLEWYLCMPW